MLDRPDISDEKIVACLWKRYSLSISRVTFLPLGADMNTFVFRVSAEGGKPYFLKLRTGKFNESSLTLPNFFGQLGIRQIISPLSTKTGRLWTSLEEYKVILYPFVEGKNGFEVAFSDKQWIEFGKALKHIHTATIPPTLTGHIPVENFSGQWRESLPQILSRVDNEIFPDPLRQELLAFLKLKRTAILDLVRNADGFARKLKLSPQPFVLCHSDIHAGNILIGSEGLFYLVDWDDLTWAPKERDLMFIGGGIGGAWNSKREETMFYEGYGPTEIAKDTLSYYRFERIVEDIAIFIEEICSSPVGSEDRLQSFIYLTSNFRPGGVVEIAYDSGKIGCVFRS